MTWNLDKQIKSKKIFQQQDPKIQNKNKVTGKKNMCKEARELHAIIKENVKKQAKEMIK